MFNIEIDIDKLFYNKLIFNRNIHEFVIDKFVILENNIIFQVIL